MEYLGSKKSSTPEVKSILKRNFIKDHDHTYRDTQIQRQKSKIVIKPLDSYSPERLVFWQIA